MRLVDTAVNVPALQAQRIAARARRARLDAAARRHIRLTNLKREAEERALVEQQERAEAERLERERRLQEERRARIAHARMVSGLDKIDETIRPAPPPQRDWLSVNPQVPPIMRIQRAVCSYYGISRVDLLSERRTANLIMPRHIAMFLAKTLTLCSLPEIGRRFGGRDHTTVLHAIRRIDALLLRDVRVASDVAALRAQVEAKS
ncbi:helix-turn-helix domain-containing protein [Roseixanthobacter pseudopolyaromaticivorans]|uniref:helix-turn-helix domain-containing protein n=1 Tax=Xanthobacteraceae TaxID=335928 RepID=UPI00372D720F